MVVCGWCERECEWWPSCGVVPILRIIQTHSQNKGVSLGSMKTFKGAWSVHGDRSQLHVVQVGTADWTHMHKGAPILHCCQHCQSAKFMPGCGEASHQTYRQVVGTAM